MSFLSKLGQRTAFKSHLLSSCLPKTSLFTSHTRNIQIMSLNTPEQCYEAIRERSPHQAEFLQAVEEVITSLKPLWEQEPHYRYVLPVIAEPERVIQFRVPWTNDQGITHVNRGFRVQFNQALGPYKGGLRFHPTVNSSIIKFLGFEQIFKNALTTLNLGGGKGGSDFNPKGKSEAEILRFCQSFMTELCNYIGPEVDVPAGDIGVGGREIGYMYGQYKRMFTRHDGVLTGKGAHWGGSLIRPEATGYGVCYITDYCLQRDYNMTLSGMRVAISGSGNVAEYLAEKCFDLDAKVLSFSDSNGSIIEPRGFSKDQFEILRKIKASKGRCEDYKKKGFGNNDCIYIKNEQPWKYVKCDIAFPSATQNEIDEDDAKALIDNGCFMISEGSNMSSTNKACDVYHHNRHDNNFIYLPAKAANAGGVAVSGLEMSQNSQKLSWTREEVDNYLKKIMHTIYNDISQEAGVLGDKTNYQLGANATGFKKVADAMFDQGMLIYDRYMKHPGIKDPLQN